MGSLQSAADMLWRTSAVKSFIFLITLYQNCSESLAIFTTFNDTQPAPGQRCAGRHFVSEGERCCTATAPCDEGEGDCDNDDECGDMLICGDNNCKNFGQYYHRKDDCCILAPEFRLEPPSWQRCGGRNFPGGTRIGTGTGTRCCTPEEPCEEGEGDCDGSEEGNGDGGAGCKGDLVCGSNNCKKFGAYYHERDDCCEDPDKIEEVRVRDPNPNIPVECPPGQRCCGRNFGSRGCCSIEEPCGEGEGDCENVNEGTGSFNNKDCREGLVCGSNNCKKFGLYYHEKDDCCEKPKRRQQYEIACAFFNHCNNK